VAAVDLTGPAAAEAERRMAAWVDDAMRQRGGPVRKRILAGQPALEATQAAREAGCDVLVARG
jgi:hypothetical protein